MERQELVFNKEEGTLRVENFWNCDCGMIYRKQDTPKCSKCGKTHQECKDSSASDLLEFYYCLLTDDEYDDVEAALQKDEESNKPHKPVKEEEPENPSMDPKSLIPLEVKFAKVFISAEANNLFDQLHAKTVADEIGIALLTDNQVTEEMDWYFWCEPNNLCHLRGEDAEDSNGESIMTYFNGNGILLNPFEEKIVHSKFGNSATGEEMFVLYLK